jgi:Cof subfamily protein (haloacid dehalogenase superfamily)
LLPSRKIELIVSDLDGTLLVGNGRIHPQNAAAIRQAIAQGVPVMLATGKTRESAVELIEMLELTTPGVFSQGMTICAADGSMMRLTVLDTAVTTITFDFAAEYNLSVIAYCLDGLRATHDDYYSQVLHNKYREPQSAICPDLRHQLDGLQITKLLISNATADSAVWADLESRLNGRAAVVQAVPQYIEAMPLDVSKGEGVGWLLNEMGVDPAAVMAIGDGENDLEMLQMVGLGIAMGNAHDSVKAVADVVVGTNEVAGVAEAINRFVLG